MKTTFVQLLTLVVATASCVDARGSRFSDRVMQRYGRPEKFSSPRSERRSIEERSASYRYLNDKTKPFMVEKLPDVPFDIGEMYSGNIPIDYNNTKNTLFFVHYPSITGPVDEVTVWLNGGPGCSSLEGFFQENGPFLWLPGTLAPVQNPYSWVNLTNMLWVEQPIGTGFATGTPTATTQEDIAAQFLGFFRNFQDMFDIENYKIYVTGESYAGRYVPYISAAMLDQKDKTHCDLTGALIYDPCIGEFASVQQEYVAVPFVQKNNNILNLNDTFTAELENLHNTCGYQAYLDKYLTFPPSGVQPALFFNYTAAGACNVFDLINVALFDVAPCFDIYNIVEIQCPLLSDVMGFPTQLTTNQYDQVYFNRSDVKQAMHAPRTIDWQECAPSVFPLGKGGPQDEGDLSADPIQYVLPQVIEIISNGDLDMIIITNGTLLAIQNMTWHNRLGFQTQPSTPINITMPGLQYQAVFAANGLQGYNGPQEIIGVQHHERGPMWAQTYGAGHMQPEFQPRVAYRHLEWLLNRTQVL